MPNVSKHHSAAGLLVAVLASLVLLVSCGSDDGDETADTTAADPAAADADTSDSSAAADDPADAARADAEGADADGSDAGDEAGDADESGAGDEAASEEPSDYRPFDEIDPATSDFYAALEGSDLVESIGEQEIYERGLTICRDFDNGTTVDAEISRLLAAGFGEDTPLIMAAAVTAICPQHVDVSDG